jgi:hypothetical protein
MIERIQDMASMYFASQITAVPAIHTLNIHVRTHICKEPGETKYGIPWALQFEILALVPWPVTWTLK